MRIRVLLWDADDAALEMCTALLEEKGYLVYACNCADRVQRVLPVIRPDVAVFHSDSPACREALRWVRSAAPDMPVLRLTAAGSYEQVYSDDDGGRSGGKGDRLDTVILSLLS